MKNKPFFAFLFFFTFFSSIGFAQDLDGDLIPDSVDIDIDNDGVLNVDEGNSDPNFITTPEAFWTFENNTNDVSGNGNNEGSGTVSPTYSAVAIEGNFSASFNGTNQEIRYSQDGGFMESAYTNISFSAWIRPTNVSGNRIIYEEGGSTNGASLWINNGTLTYSVRSGGSQEDVTHPTLISVNNEWIHVAGTFNNNGDISVYLNGVVNTFNSGFSSIPAHGGNGFIGGSDGGNPTGVDGNFEGLIDAARYESGVTWSAADILAEATLPSPDSDNDGVNNDYDLDSDNDGIADIIENGGIDLDNDGRVDDNTDTDNDGYADVFDSDNGGTPLTLLDSDNDLTFNFSDIDSDGDGVIDVIEAQLSSASPTLPAGTDSDNDGIDDSFDGANAFLTPINSDGTDQPDYLDDDSDNDGLEDKLEAYDTDFDRIANTTPSNLDDDRDGLDNSFDQIVGPNAGTNPSNNNQTSNDFPNLYDSSTPERDWREFDDSDGDGIGNGFDQDNDNDGIPNSDEENGDAIFVTTPTAFWAFDNNTNDISGNGNNQNSGTVAPNYSTDAVQGAASASFNGSSHLVRYSQDGGFMESNVSNVSYSAWIKPTSVAGQQPIIEEGGGTHGLILWLDGGLLTFSVRRSSSQQNVSIGPALTVDNQWHHVAATFNNGNITVYLDGVASNTVATGFPDIPDHTSDGYVGGANANSAGISGFYSGLIDAVRYSNTESWSALDILAENEFQSSDIDQDGFINQLDLDSDNDGIADLVEAGGTDSNNDGIVDNLADTDQDGLVNTYDTDNGGTPLADADFDTDGFKNRIDIDSDNDGIIDVIEAQASSGSPTLPSGIDTDGDGVDDEFDGGNNLLIPINTDGADTPDYIDTDSDNDSFTDALEAYDTDNDGTANTLPSGNDADEDGLDDIFDLVNGKNAGTNPDNNGQTSNFFPNLDLTGTAERDWREIKDRDNDNVADALDLDKDNDGILNFDEIEPEFITNPTAFWSFENNTNDVSGNTNNENPSGTVSPTFSSTSIEGEFSAEFNGTNQVVRYSQDNTFMESPLNNVSFSAWIQPTSISGNQVIFDEGGSGNGFTLWLNNGVLTLSTRDNNNQFDAAVSTTLTVDNNWHHVAGTYAAGTLTAYLDGVASNPVTASYSYISGHSDDGGVGGSTGNSTSANITGYFAGFIDAARYSNTVAWSSAQILQEANINSDQDGDGLANDVDLDSDGDGIPDIIEAGGIDANNDGRVDNSTDTDGDGYANVFDSDNGGTPLPIPNTDVNPVRDFLDIDSDNDGITDNVEGQTIGTFQAPSGTDTDGDGWDDNYDPDNGGSLTLSDADGDGTLDFLDIDSDNDGEPDYNEAFDDNGDGESKDDFRLRGTEFESRASNPGYYNYVDVNADSLVDWAQDLDSNGTADFLQFGSANFFDTDRDGLIDLFDPDNFGEAYTGADNNNNGIPNFRDNSEAIPLPVELVNFDAALKADNVVELFWITSSEINNDYFTVERAKKDGEFEEIAVVNGNGTTNVQQVYEAEDNEDLSGLFYYRLTQTDYDGKTKTYPAVEVFREAESFDINQVELYPNPLTGLQVNIKIPSIKDQEINFFVNDLIGKEYVSDVTVINLADFDLIILTFEQRPPNGVYLINLIVNNEIITRKLLVK